MTAGRLVLLCAGLALAGGLSGCLGGPREPFGAQTTPPPPDYDRPSAWLAFPGRDGLERSVPDGLTAVAEAEAPADVFFIHPTTTDVREVWNAPWDADDETAQLNPAVLMGQASVFNGCCRIYAPRYRQATLPALGYDRHQADDLAYADVVAAFHAFIGRYSEGRPFILASHSQGTFHAVRLLQEEIIGTPLQGRMVAAYLIGGYAPEAFPEIGLPICDAADQTGCVLSWNAAKIGSRTARLVIDDKTYWWNGGWKDQDQARAICVNPLTWRRQTASGATAPATLNAGGMPLPRAPFPARAETMPPFRPQLTGARCRDGMLEVDLSDAPAAYGDLLTRFLGSYHMSDYGLFYAAVRANASVRAAAWRP
ncbi:DUF3089 domain-containing protein [Brevundimonas staleyi]|uniref:DUF3089 domain-containing protein n=1 Tax=Brevundimonas staleyi TaxID=74326 RepID=A0ABW0FTE7_9CAUL